MPKKPIGPRFSETRLYLALTSALVGFLVIMGCLFVFSAVLTKIDAPAAVVAVMSTISLCAGGYAGGFTSARRRRKNGLLSGLLTGAVMFALIFLIGMIFARTAVGLGALSKFILTLLFGAIGGVVGVNCRRGKY